jgi:hypothetical protein
MYCLRRSPLVSVLVVALCGFVVTTSSAHATTLQFNASSGSLSASALFDNNNTAGQLKVTLTNTSSADVLAPGDVLTALFFDINIAGFPTALGRVSAVLASGSSVYYDADGQPAGGVVGGEWAYKGGLSGAPGGATRGISSTGVDLFGPGDLFPGPDLQKPDSPDGVQYGLLSAGDNTATGNGGITGSGGLIKNAVVFSLSFDAGLGVFDLSKITNVSFQYGTNLSEPNLPWNPPCTGGAGCGGGNTVVPLPPALVLFGSGLVGLTLLGVRRRRRT